MEKELDLKKVVEFLPIISAWAICFTIVDLYAHYHFFNLDIFGYVDFGELLLLSLTKFTITSLVLIIFFFVSLLHPFQNFFDGTDHLDAGHKSNIKVVAYPFFLFLVIGVLLSIIDYRDELIGFFKAIKNFSIGFTVISLPVYISTLYIFGRKEKKQIITVIFIFFFTWSIAASAVIGYTEFYEIKQEPIGNNIIFKNKLIKSSKHYYFIGQTKNYVFFHNDTLNVNDIFPSKFVSKMTLK